MNKNLAIISFSAIILAIGGGLFFFSDFHGKTADLSEYDMTFNLNVRVECPMPADQMEGDVKDLMKAYGKTEGIRLLPNLSIGRSDYSTESSKASDGATASFDIPVSLLNVIALSFLKDGKVYDDEMRGEDEEAFFKKMNKDDQYEKVKEICTTPKRKLPNLQYFPVASKSTKQFIVAADPGDLAKKYPGLPIFASTQDLRDELVKLVEGKRIKASETVKVFYLCGIVPAKTVRPDTTTAKAGGKEAVITEKVEQCTNFRITNVEMKSINGSSTPTVYNHQLKWTDCNLAVKYKVKIDSDKDHKITRTYEVNSNSSNLIQIIDVSASNHYRFNFTVEAFNSKGQLIGKASVSGVHVDCNN